MALIHMTIADTPTGGVAIHTTFKPAIGQPCSPAQGHALEIINRTHKQWGLVAAGVCECKQDLTLDEVDQGLCNECGKAVFA